MDFAAFWLDVFRDSSVAIFTCLCAVGDVLAVRPFLARRPDKLRARSLMWLSTRLTYPVRLCILAVAFTVSIMWEAYDKWADEVGRANRAEQALELRGRQQFPRFPIGHSSSSIFRRFESTEWMTLDTPAVPFDWSTVPSDADVFATIRVMFSESRNPSSCRAARVGLRDLEIDAVAGESERIPYGSEFEQEIVRIRLDRRTTPTSYALEVESETTGCAVNAQGEIGAEYR